MGEKGSYPASNSFFSSDLSTLPLALRGRISGQNLTLTAGVRLELAHRLFGDGEVQLLDHVQLFGQADHRGRAARGLEAHHTS